MTGYNKWFLYFIFGEALLTMVSLGCGQKNNQFKLYSETIVPGPDTYYSYQWFLTGKSGSSTAYDIQAAAVWKTGNKGEGINIAVVDPSSIYLRHPDISPNKDINRSFNFYDPALKTDTTVSGLSSHGTCVSGIIAARDQNSIGIVGVAPRSTLSARTTKGEDKDIFDALSFMYEQIYVSSNSYGPYDNQAELNQSYLLSSFANGISTGLSGGRNGLGTVYVWAAGNGRSWSNDRSNYDGFASHYGVMSICAVGQGGTVSDFSEPGSNLWVCAPGEDIPATDFQGLKCGGSAETGDFANSEFTKFFTGTSASTPVVAGVVGLLLREADLKGKKLGWRDVKMIIAETATKPSVSWQPTRLKFNDDYGFGIINAQAAVEKVQSWEPVGNKAWTTKQLGTGLLGPVSSGSIVDGGGFVDMKSFTVNNTGSTTENGVDIFDSSIKYIEYINLEVRLTHEDPGDLEISLVRTPKGGGSVASSKITGQHQCGPYDAKRSCKKADNYLYNFGVTNFLGEAAEGVWELKIKDGAANGKEGIVQGWRLTIYGH